VEVVVEIAIESLDVALDLPDLGKPVL